MSPIVPVETVMKHGRKEESRLLLLKVWTMLTSDAYLLRLFRYRHIVGQTREDSK